MPVIKTCETCGKEYSCSPCHASRRRYCSHPCSVKRGDDYVRANSVYGACFVCGKETKVKASHAKNGEGKYCSVACKRKVASKLAGEKLYSRVEKKCLECGKVVMIKKSHTSKEGMYCSSSCMAKGYEKRMSGNGNPNYKHGASGAPSYYRAQRLNADGFFTPVDVENLRKWQKNRCANCGESFSLVKMHVDHIYPIAKGGSNRRENIQLLCQPCNHRKHAKDPIAWANENGRLL